MATFADRVQETTTTTGTGTLTLAGAVAGYRAFSVVGNGATVYYTITDTSNNWEVGQGTYTASGTTLSRTTILASSNSNAAVSFAAGTKTVFLDLPADFLANVLQANAAKLTADLDVNGHKLTTSVANGNIVLQPNGTGSIDFSGTTTGSPGALINVNAVSAPSGGTLTLYSAEAGGVVTLLSASNSLYVGPAGVAFSLSNGGLFGDGSNFTYDGGKLYVDGLQANYFMIPSINDPNQQLVATITNPISPVNYLTLSGGAAGSPANVAIGAAGASTNIDINMKPKGSGALKVNGTAVLTANQTITLSGDVSGSGTTAITATLPTINSNVGTFSGISINGKGLVTAAVNPCSVASVTSSGTTLTLNWWNVSTYYVTLASATVAITNSGAVDGQKLNLVFIQDATGGRNVTWTSETTFGTDLTSYVPSTAAGKQDHVGMIYNATAAKYRVVGYARGF